MNPLVVFFWVLWGGGGWGGYPQGILEKDTHVQAARTTL